MLLFSLFLSLSLIFLHPFAILHQRKHRKPTGEPNQLILTRGNQLSFIMAVEAQHMNLFPSQLLTNREMIKPDHNQFYNAQMDAAMPVSSTMPESFLPFYQSTLCGPPNSINKSDSGLTYHVPVPRKRSRDSIAESNALPFPQKNKLSSQPSFLDQELLYHFQNQQSEIDCFIAQHTEKVRMELEEQRVRQSRMLLSAIQEAVVKKLKEKEEEIQRMGKLNWVLQERVKSLCVENKIWRELAQTNEATANTLRSNLEQVLAHVSEDHRHHGSGADDDAESSCGSNHQNEENNDAVAERMCSNCGVRESIVLLLPCRHLCLCTMCGSTIHNCPRCHSGINASVHVNFS
ncbi:BOI-related E3 ubiquitin-protein ligase 1-like [Gastrolobium bilobum]|uniref:BOI-related E3 ubiquitin-protein ligase 1-like n=1 Tax=Gastrolobium bilobum TaxID=150636 RepID=UPI002AB01C0C|nr:BOI-related E3 ubiquitin-protein ligase 1-like [Gastrolobium bilobum]